MPNGTVEGATDVDKLYHAVHHPAKDIHIVPGIECGLLLSMEKIADANYIAIFDKDELNICDANNTKVTVSPSAILCRWQCADTNAFLLYLMSPTTTQRPSYATNCQQSSYQNALHHRMPSTTSASSKHNPSFSATTTRPPDSQPNLHGSRQSRTNNLRIGLASWPMQSSSTSWNQMKCTRDMKGNCTAAHNQPRPRLQATTMTMTMTPNLLTLLG